MTQTELPTAFSWSGPEIYAAYSTMLALETRWVPAVSGQGRERSNPYIAYPLGKFLLGMRAARMYFAHADVNRIEPRSFLDVGCGVGTKVMLASQMGWAADGLDFVPEFVSAARELLTQQHSTIDLVDALDYQHYGGYDLIYAYNPLHDEHMHELVDEICDQTAPGTMLYLPTYEPRSDRLSEYDAAIGLWLRYDE